MIINAISDSRKIAEMRSEIDNFLIRNCANPFITTSGLEKKVQAASAKSQSPLILLFIEDKKIVGLAPLLVKERFGIWSASFLFDFWYNPDFVFEPQYSEKCIQNLVLYIFKKLRCSFAIFFLPLQSRNSLLLKKTSAQLRIFDRQTSDEFTNHRVIPIPSNYDWAEFVTSKGKYFRQKINHNQRQFSNLGRWRLDLFDKETDGAEVFSRIVEVEKASWKQDWRAQNNIAADEQLFELLDCSIGSAASYPGYKRKIWFLELNGHTIAYNIVLQYHQTAYLCKTSYDNYYRKLSPGVFLNNLVLQELFDSNEVRLVDFLTNLPVMEKWTSTRHMRVRHLLSRGTLPNLFQSAVLQPPIRTVVQRFSQSPVMQPRIGGIAQYFL